MTKKIHMRAIYLSICLYRKPYHIYLINLYFFMVDEQMKVLRPLNNTSYLVTGLFD